MPGQEERFAVVSLDRIDPGQVKGFVPALEEFVMRLESGEFVKHVPGSDSNQESRSQRGLRREFEWLGPGCPAGRAPTFAGLHGKGRGYPDTRIPGELDALRNS